MNPESLPKTVLLVDDEHAIRGLMRCALLRHGYSVYDAASGAEALSIADEISGTVDVLVTDIVMPGMDGLTLAGRLRSCHPETKVLYISGCCDEKAVRERMDQEEAGFLPKPFKMPELLAAVQAILAEGGPQPGKSGRPGRTKTAGGC